MPLTPTETRALLAQLNVVPRKNLGQNFLTDGNLVRKSLALAEIAPDDTVVEVGPGLGTLTEALVDAGAVVFAVEIDRTLAARLRETLGAKFAETFHLLEGDAVDFPRAGLLDGPEVRAGAFKIVANLPYAVCTPWLDALLSGPLPERMVLMLQREAAERFTAAAGTAERGAISIFVEAAFERMASHPVSRHCFYPEPKVDSVLLRLDRKKTAVAFHPETKKLIRTIFTQRRKQLGAIVRKLAEQNPKTGPILSAWLAGLPAHGLNSRARAEELPLHQWLNLDGEIRTASAKAGFGIP